MAVPGGAGKAALCHSAFHEAASAPLSFNMVSTHPDQEALISDDIGRARLQAHGNGTVWAAVASVVTAALFMWAQGQLRDLGRSSLWLLALVLAIGLRLLVQSRHRRDAQAAQDWPRWLWRYRAAIGLHGVVWGASVWLPVSLSDPEQQDVLLLMLTGLAVGAMTLTLFDLKAALLFALPCTLPLTLCLLLGPAPLSVATVVAMWMALLLMVMLTVAARRASRERRALAVTLRSENDNARGAREAEALLRMLFDHAGQGISVFDQQLRLRAWNQQSAEFIGVDPARVRAGLPLRVVLRSMARAGQFGPVDPEAEADRRLALAGSGRPAIVHQARADGRHIEVRRSPLPDGGVVMFIADVTEREASQVALAEQQAKLALVLERTEQGFWYIDNEQRTTDANPAMCRILGLGLEALLGRSIFDFVDEANAAVFRHHVQLRTQGQAEGYEIVLRRADGSPVHCFNYATPLIDAQGRKVGALGMFSDFSAQKQAEQQARQAGELLAQKSQLLSSTLDSLNQGVLSVDHQGRCNAWNRRFLALLQLPESLMQGFPTLDEVRRYQTEHLHFGAQLEGLDEVAREAHLRFLRGEPDNLAPRYLRWRADGTVIEVLSHFAADGSLVRTYTDVSEHHRAQAALMAARDEAERANRAKSDFLSRMSHELRTPMNAILGFGQLMEADAADPLSPGQRQRVQQLMRGGHHLLVLINEVLDIARIEAGTLPLDLHPVDVAALARDCLALVQPVAQARGVQLQDATATGRCPCPPRRRPRPGAQRPGTGVASARPRSPGLGRPPPPPHHRPGGGRPTAPGHRPG
jgi:PAS domain S-box-containing protein